MRVEQQFGRVAAKPFVGCPGTIDPQPVALAWPDLREQAMPDMCRMRRQFECALRSRRQTGRARPPRQSPTTRRNWCPPLLRGHRGGTCAQQGASTPSCGNFQHRSCHKDHVGSVCRLARAYVQVVRGGRSEVQRPQPFRSLGRGQPTSKADAHLVCLIWPAGIGAARRTVEWLRAQPDLSSHTAG